MKIVECMSGERKQLVGVFFAVVLPNILMFMLSWQLGVQRSLISIDYVFVLVVVVLGFRCLGVVLLLLVLAVDVLSVLAQIFPFMRLYDVFYLMGFISLAPAFYAFLLIIFFLVVITLLVFLWSYGRLVSKFSALLLLNFFLIPYVTIENYAVTHVERKVPWRSGTTGLIDSQSVFFAKARNSQFIELFDASEKPVVKREGERSVGDWYSELGSGGLSKRLMLVVNESWGEPVNPMIQSALLQPLYNLTGASVSVGILDFSGFTIAGEMRELCNLTPNSYNFNSVDSEFYDCLPNLLSRHGYRTQSMHGAVGLMYGRKDWYPKVGFERSEFLERMQVPRRCYSFPGACDVDLIGRIEAYFKNPGARFFYWLTLNSHSGYDMRDLFVDNFDCDSFNVEPTSASCRNLKLQSQFFTELAKSLSSVEMQGVDVIVVGDHEPVIIDLDQNKGVFESGKVSWVRVKVAAQ